MTEKKLLKVGDRVKVYGYGNAVDHPTRRIFRKGDVGTVCLGPSDFDNSIALNFAKPGGIDDRETFHVKQVRRLVKKKSAGSAVPCHCASCALAAFLDVLSSQDNQKKPEAKAA